MFGKALVVVRSYLPVDTLVAHVSLGATTFRIV